MPHWLTERRWVLAAAGLAVLATAACAEDKVRTAAGIGYGGEILGVTEAGLQIRVSGVKRVVPFGQIQAVASDDYPELERAEELYARGAEGDAEAMKKAAELYDDLLSSRSPEWLRTIVQWRMYGVYAGSGQVRKALEAYLTMARKSEDLVANLELPQPKEDQHEANKAMLKQVETVLAEAGDAPWADALRGFRVSLLLLEGDPQEILKSGVLSRLIESPNPQVRRSGMLRKLELLLAVGRTEEAAAWLETVKGADVAVPPPEAKYWEGRVLQAQEKHLRAALAYMHLPILYPKKDRARTAEALWRTGKALEAVEAPAKEARAVYQEAANDYAGTPGAERARRELARLGAK